MLFATERKQWFRITRSKTPGWQKNFKRDLVRFGAIPSSPASPNPSFLSASGNPPLPRPSRSRNVKEPAPIPDIFQTPGGGAAAPRSRQYNEPYKSL
jgi:hypothetical protein